MSWNSRVILWWYWWIKRYPHLKKYFKMQNTNLEVLHGHHTGCILCQWKNSSYKRKKHSHECSSFPLYCDRTRGHFCWIGWLQIAAKLKLEKLSKAVVKAIQGINKALQLCKDKTMQTPWDNMSQTDTQRDSECVYTHIRFKIDWYSICLEHCTRMECIHKQ